MFTRPNRCGAASPAGATVLALAIVLLLGGCGAAGGEPSPADGQTPTGDTTLTAPESTTVVDSPEGSSATSIPGDRADVTVDVTVDPQLAAALAELEALAEQIDQQLRDAAAAAANGG